MRYRKKPVVVDAFPASLALYNAGNNWRGLPEWLQDAYEAGAVIFLRDCVVIKTLEGQMEASAGDMIIRGVKGELYPCKQEIFALTYEAVEGPAS